MKEFSQAVCEKIGYYVYALKDPRTSSVFYIGKGKGNRIFQHVACALKTPKNTDKLDLIREIVGKGFEVEHYILRHGLTNGLALEIEAACIDLLGLNKLANLVKGHDSWGRGLKTVDEIVQHYDANIITIEEPTIIININQLYNPFMTQRQLYDATRSAWKIAADRRKSVKYAIAAFRGLVREVFKIESWNAKDNRWEFNGQRAEPAVRDKYLNQSLDKYIIRGSQNPIRYAGQTINNESA